MPLSKPCPSRKAGAGALGQAPQARPAGGRVYLIGLGPGTTDGMSCRARACLAAAAVVACSKELEAVCRFHTSHGCSFLEPPARLGREASEALAGQLAVPARGGQVAVWATLGDPLVDEEGGRLKVILEKGSVLVEIVPGVPLAHSCLAFGPTAVRGGQGTVTVLAKRVASPLPGDSATVVLRLGRSIKPTLSALEGAGWPSTTACLVVQDPGTPWQRSVRGDLLTIATAVRKLRPRGAAFLVVGRSVRGFAESWFEKRPLFGRTLVVTRPAHQAASLAARLTDLGAEVLLDPAIEIRSLAPSPGVLAAALADSAWVVFTSANGVDRFCTLLSEAGLDGRSLAKCKIAAIGPATAQRLESYFLKVDLMPKKAYQAEGLIDAFLPIPLQGEGVLIPRAKEARVTLIEGLEARGARVVLIPVYETHATPPPRPAVQKRFEEGRIDVVTLTSASCAKAFLARVGELANHLDYASIGPVTTSGARALGLSVIAEAQPSTEDGLVSAILERFAPERRRP